jgi:hypothetical protein
MKHPADMSTSTDEEPPSKKMRSEESLMPEAQFLAKYKVCASYHRSWIINCLEMSTVLKFICLQIWLSSCVSSFIVMKNLRC